MSGKLIMCKGLPGSGKSTWARSTTFEWKGSFQIVTKDDIRDELHYKTWSYDIEKEVMRIRDMRISEVLSKGGLVISADTNLAPKHEARLRELARKYRADFVIQSFLDVPVETCIERDLARKGDPDSHCVGEKVIRDMVSKYIDRTPQTPQVKSEVEVNPTPYKANKKLPKAILVDVDGTLALMKGRSPYDTAKADKDLLNDPIAEVVSWASDADFRVIIMSGRDSKFRDLTEQWLTKHHVPWDGLYMRPEGDKRNDAVVKLELFDNHIRDVYNVKFVLDDRDRVVKMWRKLGLTCLQVAEGNF